MQKTRVQCLGWEDPLEEEMATHSSVLAWRSHGQRNLVGYSPWGCKRVRHSLTNNNNKYIHIHVIYMHTCMISCFSYIYVCIQITYIWIYLLLLFSYVWFFCNPMDCSPPGSSVHEISQAGILEWIGISFSRGSSQPRDLTCIFCIGRWILYHLTTREAQVDIWTHINLLKK